jgi:hypothetical protein
MSSVNHGTGQSGMNGSSTTLGYGTMSPNYSQDLDLSSFMDTSGGPDMSSGNPNGNGHGIGIGNGTGGGGGGMGMNGNTSGMYGNANDTLSGFNNLPSSSSHNDFSFDFGTMNGFGGEMLATEGMDTVSDGLRGGDQNQGL